MMKPNVLFLFADQFRFDAIRENGNEVVKTPNLDRLVREGVSFTKAYTPAPICVAARCSMHYGQYPIRTDCYENTPMPTDDRVSYVEALTRGGYRTHGIGKCHFLPDSYALRGFESRQYQEELGFKDMSREDYLNDLIKNGFDYAIEPHGTRSEMYYIPQPSRMPQRLHPTQWIGDQSVKFLEEVDKERPWYLFSSFIHPHPPFAPPSPWHKLYRSENMPLPYLPEGYEALQTFNNTISNRSKYKNRGTDEHLLRTLKAYYYACVSFVDYQVGRILDALERTGQKENTVIIFASDHGEFLGDYGTFGKRTMHDPSTHIPLIISGGGFEGGKQCDVPVSLVDIAPTLLELCDVDGSDMKLDGVSLVDVYRGKTDRRGVYSFISAKKIFRNLYFGQKMFEDLPTEDARNFASMTMMYVEKDLKYCYSAADDKELLFDHAIDPKESKNFAFEADHQTELSRMRKELISFLKERGKTDLIDGDQFKAIWRVCFPEDQDRGLMHLDFHPEYFDYSALEGYLDK